MVSPRLLTLPQKALSTSQLDQILVKHNKLTALIRSQIATGPTSVRKPILSSESNRSNCDELQNQLGHALRVMN